MLVETTTPSVPKYLSKKLIKIDVSRIKICLNTSISPTSISGRREYCTTNIPNGTQKNYCQLIFPPSHSLTQRMDMDGSQNKSSSLKSLPKISTPSLVSYTPSVPKYKSL